MVRFFFTISAAHSTWRKVSWLLIRNSVLAQWCSHLACADFYFLSQTIWYLQKCQRHHLGIRRPIQAAVFHSHGNQVWLYVTYAIIALLKVFFQDCIFCLHNVKTNGSLGSRWFFNPSFLWWHLLLHCIFQLNPDRFLNALLQKYLSKSPFIFWPFNAGSRICPGQQVRLRTSL